MINRVSSVGYSSNGENRKFVDFVIVSSVITKRSFFRDLITFYVTSRIISALAGICSSFVCDFITSFYCRARGLRKHILIANQGQALLSLKWSQDPHQEQPTRGKGLSGCLIFQSLKSNAPPLCDNHRIINLFGPICCIR